MAPRRSRLPGYTDREQLTAELQRRSVQLFVTLASIGDAVITTGSTGEITFLNPVAENLTGWSLEEAVGLDIESVFRVIDEATEAPLPSSVRVAVEAVSKVILPHNAVLVRKDASRVPVDDSAAPIVDMDGNVLGAVLVFRDITERKRAERTIRYRSELDRMAARISTAFITTPVANVDFEIDEALREIGEFLAADRTYVALFNEDSSAVKIAHEWCAEGIEPLRRRSMLTSRAPYWSRMILDRNYIFVSSPDHIPAEAAEERTMWAESATKTLVSVPMLQEDRVLGLVAANSIRETKPWPEDVIDLLYLIGNVFASAMARRDAQRKLDAARAREVEIGSRIQQALLLSEPPATFADFQVAARTIPSRKIDGDFYDFLTHPNRCLDVIFGDVMGKGVPAALLAAGSKTEFLRSLSHLLASSRLGVIPQPQDIVNGVHAVLTPQLLNLDSFVTLSYVRFDPTAAKVFLVDCGNTRLLRCTAQDGVIDHLPGFNVPLGFSVYELYSQAEFDYQEHDVFVLYSDGATEARNSAGDMFGIRRLSKIVTANRHLAPHQIARAVERAVIEFAGAGAISDDLTLVVVKIVPEADWAPRLGAEELQFRSSLTELAAIRDFLRGFCELRGSCGLNEHGMHMLELAVTEVASNIIKHAYLGKDDQPLWIRIELTEEAVTVTFVHVGTPFTKPDRIPPPSFNGSREGGFGLFIINHSVDEIGYGTDDHNRQYIELTKKLPG